MKDPFDKALDALLAWGEVGESPDEAPGRAIVDYVLTAGYAQALELEAERMRVTIDLDRILADGAVVDSEVDIAKLRADLGRVSGRLGELRDRLAEVNQRFGVITPVVPADAPGAEDRPPRRDPVPEAS
jgi:hypothetical protein